MTSFENPARDWLVVYTDQELMIVRKIFEDKTNLQIGNEMDLSSKSINIRILTIFKKMGISTGLASKNKIIYFFGTKHAQHLDKIKNFEMPPPENKEHKFIKMQDLIQQQNEIKIEFILKHKGYGVYDNKNIPYSREQLLCLNNKFLDKVFKRTCAEVEAAEKNARDLREMTVKFPILPTGVGQFNGICYESILTCHTDKKRILLLFPKSKHKYITGDQSE